MTRGYPLHLDLAVKERKFGHWAGTASIHIVPFVHSTVSVF